MDNSLDPKQDMSPLKVDAEWYRETYPDVAQAGIDPTEHYLQHGCTEGRFPRPLKSLMLEQALWGGFSQRALSELHCLYESTVSPEERSYAAWALARWYASNQAWNDALHFVEVLKEPQPPFLDHPGIVLLGVEILLRIGHIEDARHWIHSAMAERPGLPDWALAAANVLFPREEQYAHEDDLRLAWVNSVWQGTGLATVRKKNSNTSLSLDNLRPTQRSSLRATQQVKISVLMPAFNASKWIRTALESLLNQTWKNLEIIVVDDASSDDTVEQVRAMASRDPRITLLQQCENQGAYVARNRGLEHATGEFVTNHDSDDWSHPERLEKMVQPLLNDRRLVATLADWVRVDSNLHFQAWRIERSLVEPSVSTLMCRKRALEQLGGWDNVRVAADCELYQRLQRAYGKHSVTHLAPGTPLVLARQLPGSLTTAASTHLRTMFFGARRLYQEMFEIWHASAVGPHALRLSPLQRAFPAPAAILGRNVSNTHYDWVIMADLSVTASTHDTTRALIQYGLDGGKRLALFHWPRFHISARTDSFYLTQAIDGRFEIMLPEEKAIANRLFIIDSTLLANPPDRVPKIHFDRCQAIPVGQGAVLDDFLKVGDGNHAFIKDGFPQQPSEFNANWYLDHNPDVRAAGVDPWQHYLEYGAAEGREPSPDFNSPYYLSQCPDRENITCPPLVHYLKVGRALGHNPQHPIIQGLQPRQSGKPTLLLCAHAAGEQLFGAERSFLDVVEACNALSMNVLISLPSIVNRSYIEVLRAMAQKIFCVPTTIWQANVPICHYAVRRLTDIIRSDNVDIVHANTIMLREPLLAAKELNVPTVVHAHEVPENDEHLCHTLGLDAEQVRARVNTLADYLLANSEFTAKWYNHPKQANIVSGTVDGEVWDIPNVLSQGQLVAGLISSNQPKKGLCDVIELARILAATKAAVKLIIIGPENAYVKSIRDAIEGGQLPKNLSLGKYVPTPKAAIEQCNVVLNLSHCNETFGRTVLEAMAAKRPVIAYKKGALPELIQDGYNGFLAAPGDIARVAYVLERLSTDVKLVTSLGEAGHRMAAKYTKKRLESGLAAAYEMIDWH